MTHCYDWHTNTWFATKQQKAECFLRELLSSRDRISAREGIALAVQCGISSRTLDLVRGPIVRCVKAGMRGGWYWRLRPPRKRNKRRIEYRRRVEAQALQTRKVDVLRAAQETLQRARELMQNLGREL